MHRFALRLEDADERAGRVIGAEFAVAALFKGPGENRPVINGEMHRCDCQDTRRHVISKSNLFALVSAGFTGRRGNKAAFRACWFRRVRFQIR